METVGLYFSVPVASFRVPRAREYFETFPVPPPATVYGMLLSMVGEVNRRVYEGAEIAVALLSEPAYSVVLRTLWRVKKKESGLGLGENRRPDFQELLTDVSIGIWIRVKEKEESSLAHRVKESLENPSKVNRFGGLALGESTHLINEVSFLEKMEMNSCQILLNSDDGDLSLPIWADHVSSSTNWGQFKLSQIDFESAESIPEASWTTIQRNQ